MRPVRFIMIGGFLQIVNGKRHQPLRRFLERAVENFADLLARERERGNRRGEPQQA